jgi:Lipocalin-like domain
VNLIVCHFITASVLIFGMVLPIGNAAAQTTAKDLVGTWTLVSITIEQDGKKIDFYGPNPQGQETYDSNGHVSVIITRSDLPKFASNNRQSGTPEENKAVVQGSFAYFGTYSVSETDKTITTHIVSSTFPNWNGVDRKLSFNISGDELNITTPNSSTGAGSNQQVWRRAR